MPRSTPAPSARSPSLQGPARFRDTPRGCQAQLWRAPGCPEPEAHKGCPLPHPSARIMGALGRGRCPSPRSPPCTFQRSGGSGRTCQGAAPQSARAASPRGTSRTRVWHWVAAEVRGEQLAGGGVKAGCSPGKAGPLRGAQSLPGPCPLGMPTWQQPQQPLPRARSPA